MSPKSGLLLGAAVAALTVARPLVAQGDSLGRTYRLDTIVVVAQATPTRLRESVAAATVLDRGALERLPVRTLADALQYVPGLNFISIDGAGAASLPVARGFFGGGETDYVLLAIDGVPANALRTGVAEWNQIPLEAVERIEVLRGNASSAFGDAAVAGVVNVITRSGSAAIAPQVRLGLGSWAERSVYSSLNGANGADRFAAAVFGERVAGFRRHSDATNVRASGHYGRRPGAKFSQHLNWNLQRLTSEDPGPLAP